MSTDSTNKNTKKESKSYPSMYPCVFDRYDRLGWGGVTSAGT